MDIADVALIGILHCYKLTLLSIDINNEARVGLKKLARIDRKDLEIDYRYEHTILL